MFHLFEHGQKKFFRIGLFSVCHFFQAKSRTFFCFDSASRKCLNHFHQLSYDWLPHSVGCCSRQDGCFSGGWTLTSEHPSTVDQSEPGAGHTTAGPDPPGRTRLEASSVDRFHWRVIGGNGHMFDI